MGVNLGASLKCWPSRIYIPSMRCIAAGCRGSSRECSSRGAAQDEQESFEEVRSRLDTVWVDLAAERLVLLWRGVIRVRSPRMREIAAICTALQARS